MARHDLICRSCGLQVIDASLSPWPDKVIHLDLGVGRTCGEFDILWSSYPPRDAAVHTSERAVVWYHPKYGYRYPGRNDRPMPRYYARQGYERRELPTLHDIHRLEKDGNVLSEVAWFDKGSGRDFLGE